MTSARVPIQDDYWPPGVTRPPRGIDLPYDDAEPMETPNHRYQMNFLIEVFTLALNREDVFVGGNQAVYYSLLQAKNNDFKAPDMFVVLDAIDNPDRRSWVLWEEDLRTPNVVVELLSESTEANDRGPKKRVYERLLKVPDYYLYDPVDFRFEGYRLEDGQYAAMTPDDHGRLPCREVGLWLGRWTGTFMNRTSTWLRLYDADGEVIPTEAEAATKRANAATARADAAEARVAALLAELAKRG